MYRRNRGTFELQQLIAHSTTPNSDGFDQVVLQDGSRVDIASVQPALFWQKTDAAMVTVESGGQLQLTGLQQQAVVYKDQNGVSGGGLQVKHGSHGDMITAPNIQVGPDGFVEAFGQTGGHVFATDNGGQLTIATGGHVSISVLQQSDGPIVSPIDMEQPVSLTSSGEIKLTGELWLSGADEAPLINARRVQTLPDSNVSMSPGYQGRMLVADEVIINGQLVLYDLYASEHRVETMREFEQAWHLDEPDQTIRLEADIVDDIATGLAPRTQDVTLIGDGYELAFAPEQNVSIFSTLQRKSRFF
ncbi:hypothetical protein H7R52_12035 [Weissella confusa]|uniref:Uncharacterized protein n=1 Tax=Weissella confusa TaxID=1583 RepID=A0A923NI11_WEICO|nr:hypothetical protein [Weissella confusa]